MTIFYNIGMTMRTEEEFLEAIDCRFPFADRDQALGLIDEGCRLSSNAGFALVDEIVRPPRSAVASVDFRLDLLRRVFDRLHHPLVAAIRPLAERLVGGGEATVEEALAIMHRVATYRGQYAALSVAYFSADDTAGMLDREYNPILAAWAAQQGHATDGPQAARG